MRSTIVDNYEKESSCYYSTARMWDDGIILPEDTRKVLGLSVLIASNNIKETKHGVFRMWVIVDTFVWKYELINFLRKLFELKYVGIFTNKMMCEKTMLFHENKWNKNFLTFTVLLQIFCFAYFSH